MHLQNRSSCGTLMEASFHIAIDYALKVSCIINDKLRVVKNRQWSKLGAPWGNIHIWFWSMKASTVGIGFKWLHNIASTLLVYHCHGYHEMEWPL